MSGKLKGKVVSVSESGNLVTDISEQSLHDVPRDDQVRVSGGGHFTLGIYPADHSEPDMTFLAMLGESGFLELSLVGENAGQFLGIPMGADIELEW